MPPSPALRFTLNGRAVDVAIGQGERLLTVLRDRLGVTDITDGCSPQGQCGCCTVWVDGSPRVACATPADRVADRSVVTPSGLPQPIAAALAGAFARTGGSQCGFCSPGIVMRLAALLERNQKPGPTEMNRALAAHICRCTGWEPIREACVRAGAALAGLAEADPVPSEALALGQRAYVDDRRPADTWHAVLLLAPGPGRLRSAIAVADGITVIPLADQAGHDGVALAIVAGPDRAELRAAEARVGLDWEAGEPPPDVDSMFLWPAHPAFLEPESVIADAAAGLVVTACERAGDIPDAQIVSVPDGGSFGGKRVPWLEDLAMHASATISRPVTLTLSREESIRSGPTRHGARGDITLEDGCLRGAIEFIAGSRSLCREDVLEMASWCLPGPYRLESGVALSVTETWGPPSGWMRGEGSLAAVALRERAIGPGLERRLALVDPQSPAAGCLAALAVWVDGGQVDGVAVHVHRLPEAPWARWSEAGVLQHPFATVGELPVVDEGTGDLGPAPRGGGWPFVLVSRADGANGGGGPGVAVAAAVTNAGDGAVATVRVVVDAGRLLDPVMAEGHARGGSHMGLGAALSERVVRQDGRTKSLTIRSLGVIPAAATPAIEIRFIGDGPALAGVAEACVAPVAAATMAAVGGRSLPDLDTRAGRQIRRQR